MPAGRDLTLTADGVYVGPQRVVHVAEGPAGVLINTSGLRELPEEAADHVIDLLQEVVTNHRLKRVAELLCAPAPAREAAR